MPVKAGLIAKAKLPDPVVFPVASPGVTAEVVSTDSLTLSPVAEAAECKMPAEVNAPDGFKRTLVKVAAGAAKPNVLLPKAGMLPVPALTVIAPGVVPSAAMTGATIPPAPV